MVSRSTQFNGFSCDRRMRRACGRLELRSSGLMVISRKADSVDWLASVGALTTNAA